MALARRTILIGLDGTSPQLCQHMMRKGKIKMRASKVEEREKIRELYRRAEEEGEP